jgi:hypothetical protein
MNNEKLLNAIIKMLKENGITEFEKYDLSVGSGVDFKIDNEAYDIRIIKK